MALLLEWLMRMPPLVGSLAWFYLKVGMTLVIFFWVFRLVEGTGAPFPPWAKVATILLSLRPIMGDLYHNNVNIFIRRALVLRLCNIAPKRRDIRFRSYNRSRIAYSLIPLLIVLCHSFFLLKLK